MKRRDARRTDILEILASLLDSVVHSLLPLTNPDTRIVVLMPKMVNFHLLFAATRHSHLLVGFIFTLGIANLSMQVALLLLEVVLNWNHGQC
jgi:ketopantoate reductase